jgi:uncharacterized repeat protein (TIGR02059 family)
MSQPSYFSSVGYIAEQFFTLSFDVALDAANPPPANAFAVQINGTPTTVTSVSVDSAAKTVTLSFSASALVAGDIIAFSYTDPTGGDDASAIQGTDGADSAAVSSSTVVSGPRPPSVTAVDSASDTGAPGDGITKDTTPTLTGTADANATVKLYDTDGTTLLGTTTADGWGDWSITSSILADGPHTLRATQTDSGNNTSPLSTGVVLTIDTAVAAPTGVALSPGSDSGTLGDGISNSGAPTMTGHAEANATVRLYDTDGTTILGSTTADGSGNWSITSSALAIGTHVLTAKQTDIAGNASGAFSGFVYTLDTIGPTGMALSTDTVAEAFATNGSTIATLSATDATAIQYGFAVGNGTIDADNAKFTVSGSSLVAAQNLGLGSYHIYMKATDAAGNDTFQIFTIDVVDAPIVTAIERAAAASSTVPTAATAVVYTVTFSQPVSGVGLSDFALTATGSAAGTIVAVTGSGDTYTVTVNGVSGDGALRLDLNASGTGIQNGSAIGISGGYSAGETFSLDHTAPAAASTPQMTAGTDSGASSSDAITSDTTPAFTGTAEVNATVKLYDTDGTTLLGTTVADGSGNWSITSSHLSEGAHTLTVRQTDAAGNVSAASAGLTATIDTTAPTVMISSDDANLKAGQTATITFAFSEDPGTSFVWNGLAGDVGVAGGMLGAISGSGLVRTATFTPTALVNNGSASISVAGASYSDAAGNLGAGNALPSLTFDTVVPPAPSTPDLDPASDLGTSDSDDITTVTTPTFTGTAENGATVKLYGTDGTTVLGTATAMGGNWSITSSALSVGPHTITATATDAAGNESVLSSGLSVTIEAPPTSNPPVSAETVSAAIAAISFGTQPQFETAQILADIAAGKYTFAEFIDTVIASVQDTVLPALVVTGILGGERPTEAHLAELAVFATAQLAAYTAMGVAEPRLGPYEAMGLGYSETATFKSSYGAMADEIFSQNAYNAVFGRAATAEQLAHFNAQLAYFETIYQAAGQSIVDADLHAKGAVFGQMIGVAIVSEAQLHSYDDAANAFLKQAAFGQAQYGEPLGLI